MMKTQTQQPRNVYNSDTRSNKIRIYKKRILTLVFYLSPLLPLQFYMQGNWYSITSTWTIALIIGVVAFVYFINSIVLASRIPFLERIVGIDGMIRIHIVQASIGLMLGLVHGRLREVEMGEFLRSSWYVILAEISLKSIVLIIILTTLFMVNSPISNNSILNRVRVFVHNTLGLRYAFWKRVHSMQLLAMVILIVHMYFASSTQETYGRLVVMGLYSLAGIAAFLYRFVYLPFTRCHFEVAECTSPSDDVIQLCLVPKYKETKDGEAGHKTIGHKAIEHKREERLIDRLEPGQFVYFSIRSPRRITTKGNIDITEHPIHTRTRKRRTHMILDTSEHPFTLSKIDRVHKKLYITARRYSGLTRQLANIANLSKGKGAVTLPRLQVLLEGPYGVFTLPPPELSLSTRASRYLFYASGIGITPFSAMLEDMVTSIQENVLSAEAMPSINLFYSGKHTSSMPFVQRLYELMENLPTMRIVFFLTRHSNSVQTFKSMLRHHEQSATSVNDNDGNDGKKSAPLSTSVLDRIVIHTRRIRLQDIKDAIHTDESLGRISSSSSYIQENKEQYSQETGGLWHSQELHYMCGTNAFIAHIRNMLKKLGVQRPFVRFEKFSL